MGLGHEKQVDDILILMMKKGNITKANAKDDILKVDNLDLLDIDENNVDEVIDLN